MSDKIIGGEFQIESDALTKPIVEHIEPHYSLGRTCLYSILSTIHNQDGVVLLPDYICSSAAEVPIRIGLPIKHYHVKSCFYPDMEDIRKKLRSHKKRRVAVLLISYYGLIDLDETISIIRNEFPDVTIIVDDVQNIYGFGKHIDYNYCFTSYRKWFAVPDGADILTKPDCMKVERYTKQAEYASYKAAGNLLKNHREMINDSIALELIDEGENMMDAEYLFCCSKLSTKLIKRIDFKSIANQRKKNAAFLHRGLEEIGIPHLYNSDKVPLFVPITTDCRDKIREKLFDDNIFVPIHWPVEDYRIQGHNELYRTELSLICDQRYDEEDMERIIRGIKNAL